jgi:hypothetical protein
VIHVHLTDAALTGATGGVARVENIGGLHLITPDQVREWCGNEQTSVVVRPVLDLAEHLSVDAYEATQAIHERVTLTHPTCVFPWCTRQSRRADADHIVPWDPDTGPTCTTNLAPLCRHHHQHKTHGRWRYRRLGPTSFLWTSPHGLRFLRDHTGTVPIDRPPDHDVGPPCPRCAEPPPHSAAEPSAR